MVGKVYLTSLLAYLELISSPLGRKKSPSDRIDARKSVNIIYDSQSEPIYAIYSK